MMSPKSNFLISETERTLVSLLETLILHSKVLRNTFQNLKFRFFGDEKSYHINLSTTSTLKPFKSFRWNIFYWFLHILFLVFFIIRGIVVSNTPEAVHIPRIEYVNEINIGDEHYQFMNRSEFRSLSLNSDRGSHP